MGHFLKMLIGLTCMAVIGLAGFALVNHYSKGGKVPLPGTVQKTPATSSSGGTVKFNTNLTR